MKTFNKIIIFLLSAMVCLSGLALPSLDAKVAHAGSSTEGQVLELDRGSQDVREFEIGEGFDFTDYSIEAGVEVKVWAPDGSVASEWTATNTAQNFVLPGVYSFQFRTTAPRTYSDFYHFVIKKTGYSIEFEDVYIPYALIGSTFTLPSAGVFDADGNRIQDADVRVFDFRGNAVVISEGKFSSSVTTAVSYFVEYSYTSGSDVLAKEFVEVKFVSELPLVLSNLSLSLGKQKGQIDYATTFDVFRDYDIASARVVDTRGNVVPSAISLTIYNATKNKYISATGWTLVDAAENILVNSRTPKFFIDHVGDFSANGISEIGNTYIFTYTAETALGSIVKTITKDSVFNDDIFSINFLGQVPSMLDVVVNGVQNSSDTQTTYIPNFEIVFDADYHKDAILSCMEFSTEITKSTDSSSYLSIVFNSAENKFSLAYYKEVASQTSFYLAFFINYNIKSSSFTALKNQDFSNVTVDVISYEGNSYNKDSGENAWTYSSSSGIEYRIKKNLSQYDLYANGDLQTTDIEISTSNFTQLVYAGYTLIYSSTMGYWSTTSTTSNDMSRSLTLNADGTFNFDYYHTQNQSNGVPLQGKMRISMSTKTITLNDIDVAATKPNNIKVGDFKAFYSAVSGGTEVTLPSASASFYYTVGGTTFDALNKHCFDVSITGGTYVGSDFLPGDQVVLNDSATYTITYTAKSIFGGSRSVSFEITVGETSADASAATEMAILAPDFSTGVIAESAKIENIFAIDVRGEMFTPNLTFTNGFVTKFALDGEWSAVTFVRRGATTSQSVLFKTIYSGIETPEILTPEFVLNAGVGDAKNLPAKNGTKEVVVGDFIYFGDANISIAEFSGVIIVKNKTIAFMSAGTYTLSLIGTDFFYTIKVSNGADMTIESALPQSPVVTKGIILEPGYVFIPNFFGYRIDIALISSSGNAYDISKFADIDRVDSYTLSFKATFAGVSKTASHSFISGSLKQPTITISSRNEDVTFSGEKIDYEIKNASALDQFGNEISNILVTAFDPNGKQLEIKDGKIIISLAGEYSIYYYAVDADGNENLSRVTFVSTYAEIEESEGALAWWEILLITLGSVIGAGVLGFAIFIIIKKVRGKHKFASKRKKDRRKQKGGKTFRISVAQFKDDKTWFVKKNDKMVAKCKSKEEAVTKAREIAGTGTEIKIYAKSGRLIDTLK